MWSSSSGREGPMTPSDLEAALFFDAVPGAYPIYRAFADKAELPDPWIIISLDLTD